MIHAQIPKNLTRLQPVSPFKDFSASRLGNHAGLQQRSVLAGIYQ
jgi:hypothetical protein